jgi:hypothetical protein
VRHRIERPYTDPPELRAYEFAIADAGDDSFLGTLMLHSCDWRHRRAEVGFWVVPWARGRGVVSAALGLALDWAFGDLGLERIEMTALPDNDVVPRVAERFGSCERASCGSATSNAAVASTSSSGASSARSATPHEPPAPPPPCKRYTRQPGGTPFPAPLWRSAYRVVSAGDSVRA